MNNNNNNRNRDNQLPNTGRNPYYSQRQPSGQYQYRQAPQGYPPVRHRSRKQAQKAAGLVVLSAVILVMLLISVIIFAARCANGSFSAGNDTTTEVLNGEITGDAPPTSGESFENQTSETLPPETTEPVTEALDPTYEYIEKTAGDVHKGYQILVNYQNEYTFDGDFDIKPFYGNKNTSYKVSDTLVSFDMYAMGWCNKMMEALAADLGNGDALVNSSYRTMEQQENIYAYYLDKYGEEYAQLYVAIPGYSEHHTGLAVDFTVYTNNGESYTFDDKPEYPEWLKTNGYKYGFIQRYPSDKTDFTKIAYENWHYRYVGKPHAFYMVKNNLCFEEYIDFLRKFEFGETHLAITDDEGTAWEIYFVPADPSGVTRVPVPKYREYELSGNNVDGFIVTCQK